MTKPVRLWVTRQNGERTKRSTGTRSPQTVRQMQAMLDALGRNGAQAWDIVDAIADGAWSLPDVLAAWSGNVYKLRERLADTALAGLVEPYLASLGSRVTPDTVAHYRVGLRSLVQSIPLRSGLTVGNIERWLTALPYSGGTQRKYAAAASGFCAWLVRQGSLPTNPVRDVPKPSAGKRSRWVPSDVAQRIADAQPEPYRALSYLLHGTGLDVGAALALRREQLDLERGTLHNVRPKTRKRHTAVVASWALPVLRDLCRGKLPHAPLFVGLDRWRAADAHRRACQSLGIADYWMRDARHSYAVRLAQAGMPLTMIAECLGHCNAQLVATTYAHHVPSGSDLAAWEAKAQSRDVG